LVETNIFLFTNKHFCSTIKFNMSNTHPYIGYKPEDYKMPFARFYNENIAPISLHAAQALSTGNLLPGSLPSLEQARTLANPGYTAHETGYSMEKGGAIRVAVLTNMPNVSPEMWDWWFGWHGCMDSRYKLWHPRAHRAARWQDGGSDVAYINRNSHIEEYIGSKMEKAAIQFKDPLQLGFQPDDISDKTRAVYICARLGYSRLPIDFGWLVHQIRATTTGAEMRSRFWMGGPHIAIRGNNLFAKTGSSLLQKTVKLPESQAKELLTHCAEEMAHLASFLPALYSEQSK
jgi:DAPG hydrolase PhiG domain